MPTWEVTWKSGSTCVVLAKRYKAALDRVVDGVIARQPDLTRARVEAEILAIEKIADAELRPVRVDPWPWPGSEPVK